MTRKRHREPVANTAALESARQMVTAQRKTCEGCLGLRTYPRPMCQSETSPHYRQVRDTYHDRCEAFSVKFRAVEAPPVAEPPPASRAAVAGEVAKHKHNRWQRRPSDDELAALLARNEKRKVGA